MEGRKRVLVCVTQQKTCERLIKKGAGMSEKIDGELFIIHVAMNGFNFLGNSKEGDALEYLFNISKSVGADLTVLRSSDIVKTIIGFVKDNKISNVVLGEPPDESNNSIVNELKRKLTCAEIYVVPSEED